jgi:DNA-binding CsgD family transcriptional regulator
VVGQTTPFVGREADLTQLRGALAQAADGRGSLVLVHGEAGIGKTRLCNELRQSHHNNGGQTLLGRASPEEAALSCGPLADTLRAAHRAEPILWEVARTRSSILWELVPELSPQIGGQHRSVDRPVLFEALLDAVDEAAGERTTLWVLDDIQWADDATWEFVRYASRRVADLSLVLVVTYREEELGPAHPWWPNLVRLKREPSVITLGLSRISAEDGEKLVRTVAPMVAPDIVAGIVERSAGTPLLVEELANLASRSSQLPPVPDVVHVTVRQRAARLGPQGRALLDVAAVVGQEVDVGLLASLQPEGQADELLSVGLVERDDGRMRFRHPLFQEAAYHDIPADQRRVLHERIATALADDRTSPAERIASHLERAGLPQAALSLLESAAEVAIHTGLVGRAATLHVSALHMAHRHQSLSATRADLERKAIRDLFRAGRWSELDPLVRAAWSTRHRLSASERATLAAVAASHLFWTGAIGDAWAIAEEECASAEQRGSVDDAAPLFTEGGLIAWFRGDTATACRYLDRAIDIARRTGDRAVQTRAECLAIIISYDLDGDRSKAVARLREKAALAAAHGLLVQEGLALLYLCFLTARLDDAVAARVASTRAGVWYSSTAACQEFTQHLIEGRITDAENVLTRIRYELRPAVATMSALFDAREATLFLHRGDLSEARRLLYGPAGATEASRYGFFACQWSATHGWLAWEEQRWEDAAAHFVRSEAQRGMPTYADLPRGQLFFGIEPFFWIVPLHVDALLRLSRRGDAATTISAAESFMRESDVFLTAGLSAARFRYEPTADRAAEAEALSATAPCPWLRAQLVCWRGEFLHDAHAAEAARELYAQIGAHLGVRRAEAVLGRLGSSVPTEHGDALSPRELEVAELVAEGLSNPAIARRLYLSRPTVASHVAHILTKLDFSSRAQIAAWVAERRVAARSLGPREPSASST